MISGTTGAVAVELVVFTKSHGLELEYIFTTVVLAGILQILVGFLNRVSLWGILLFVFLNYWSLM